jgi:hypothetical protein
MSYLFSNQQVEYGVDFAIFERRVAQTDFNEMFFW